MNTLYMATDYNITLNIQDFMWGMFILALIILVIFIIVMIAKIIQNLSVAHKILKKNALEVDMIIKNAASISTNADTISKDLAHASNKFLPSVDNIAEAGESITKTFKDNNPVNEAIVGAYKTVHNVNKLASQFKNKKDKKS